MSIKEMFTEIENNEVTTNKRGLAGTAQLTTIANQLVEESIDVLNNNYDTFGELFEASKSNHKSMDDLLDKLVAYDEVDVEFIKQLDEAVVDGMLKSQQSKRSRAKGKVMTLDNYKAMMAGAIAENLLRKATGKVKTASGVRRGSGAIVYTDEQLAELCLDQEQLRKDLRNIQSKKSIMKSKADFDENSERWQLLCQAEEQLKEIRVTNRQPRVVKVDETKEALVETLAGIDLEHIKAGESKALLEQIKAMIGGE